MSDVTIALVLAGAFAMGGAAVCGLARRPEIAIRALSVITLGFGVFLGLAVVSQAPETVERASVRSAARH